MKKLIVVSDWADDRLTRQEFRIAVEGFLKSESYPPVSFVSSTPSTIHTSFLVNEVCEIEERLGRPLNTVIFQNTDPRLQAEDHIVEAQGAEFIVAKLISGIYLCGPNAGYDYSLVKDRIEKFFMYQGMSKGSQFRSRDLYSRICAHLMEGMQDELELEEVSTTLIPALSGFHIGHIDNYGNIKTTITREDFKGKYEYEDEVVVRINSVEKKALFVPNLFANGLGTLVIYPGSSGKKDNSYLEISVWRHFTEDNPTTGAFAFNHPRPGAIVEIVR